ncbi:MAG: LytTR family DNA-binding domain-containing protein [Butyrivibrio sp.]|nr:LytTR family DNA-binding domain-containing protein [Muribaculum sp.]MCM1552475.1 LytTR family DNA-binding domain-containing protein [Butyrivibrio sp.]
MRIAICEDELQAQRELQAVIADKGRELALYSDTKDLLADWKAGVRFDVIFTDLVMEDEPAGMELCKMLSKENGVFLVVVTNYIEYAPEGYRNGVFRYLLKPVTREIVEQVFADMRENQGRERKFMVDAFEGSKVISSASILYVEVHGRYLDIYVHDEQGRETTITLMQSLKEFAAQLPEGHFFRINRNQLISLAKIVRVSQGGVVLENGRQLSVSRRLQRELKEMLARFLA